MRRLTLLLIVGLAGSLFAAEDGKRAVDVPRFGVHVRVPQAWELVDWNRDDTAFVVDLPQDSNSPVGHVSCKITAAPEDLEAVREQIAADTALPPVDPNARPSFRVVSRKLVRNEIADVKTPPAKPEIATKFGRRLTAEWQLENVGGVRYYERRIYAVADGLLYVFTFDSDESHYDSYVVDFEEMFAAAKIDPLELPLVQLPGGYWMQRDFRFALKLPDGWRPAFGASEKVLLYAVGKGHGSFTDDVAVLASPPKPLELERLKVEMPGDVRNRDSAAEVECRIVPQGAGSALETLVRTKRGDLKVTTLERRFQTRTRNYEVKVSCESQEFTKREAELRAVLDGFAELPDEPKAAET